MIKIKLSIPGFYENINISTFTGNKNNLIEGCKFYINDESSQEFDFWFVIDDLFLNHESALIDNKNIYYLTGETFLVSGYYDTTSSLEFLGQFNEIYSSQEIFLKNSYYDLPYLPWMINSNHGFSIFQDNTKDINWFKNNKITKKEKIISIFCSNKIFSDTHKLRLKFTQNIKSHFGNAIDWYGNGINPLDEKWYGIAPYKYHIVLENQSRNNVITEKIYDAYLGESFPIYWGAPNLSNYFNTKSFESIDIYNLKGSIRTIENIILRNLWEERQDYLQESKIKVLNDYNIFKRIANLAKSKMPTKKQSKIIKLNSIKTYSTGLRVKIKNIITKVALKI